MCLPLEWCGRIVQMGELELQQRSIEIPHEGRRRAFGRRSARYLPLPKNGPEIKFHAEYQKSSRGGSRTLPSVERSMP